ncbi:unnamed protein product [marine sediment metagenome]|uniref:Uncharacterized protein n=1 Tax=marine sediment metagenome TaxID=412755 RepID=X1B9X9_9ZZZZ
MDRNELKELYPNGYKREHTHYLKDAFNINPNGVDYHTPNNVGVEFKETFAKDDKNLWFKIPKKQVDLSDVFVFCVKNENFYVVDKEDILGQYSFNTYQNRANMRLGKVKSMAIFETNDIQDLKIFLDQLEM